MWPCSCLRETPFRQQSFIFKSWAEPGQSVAGEHEHFRQFTAMSYRLCRMEAGVAHQPGRKGALLSGSKPHTACSQAAPALWSIGKKTVTTSPSWNCLVGAKCPLHFNLALSGPKSPIVQQVYCVRKKPLKKDDSACLCRGFYCCDELP